MDRLVGDWRRTACRFGIKKVSRACRTVATAYIFVWSASYFFVTFVISRLQSYLKNFREKGSFYLLMCFLSRTHS